jgi:hypothetical protein
MADLIKDPLVDIAIAETGIRIDECKATTSGNSHAHKVERLVSDNRPVDSASGTLDSLVAVP